MVGLRAGRGKRDAVGLTAWAVAALVTAFLCAGLVPAFAEPAASSLRRFGAAIDIVEPLPGRVIAGGARVGIKAPVQGDVWVTGADIAIEGDGVGGGVWAVGAEVEVKAQIGSSATLFGSRISVDAPVAGDINAVGGSISIGPAATIGGQAKLYGAAVDYRGQTTDRVTIEGDTVFFDGSARGTVRIEGLKIRIGERARIEGALEIYTIGEPEIVPGATIVGAKTINRLHDSQSMRTYLRGLPFGLIVPAAIAASALIAGLFLLWLGRGGVERVTDELIDSPGSSVFWGLALLILLPVCALLLAFTVLGLPVAVLSLLALPLLLLFGFASSGFGLGEWVFNRLGEPRSAGQRALQLLGGLVILVLLGLLPYAGPLLLVIAAVTGLGAMLRSQHDGMRARSV